MAEEAFYYLLLQYCLKLQNIIYCIFNMVNNHRTSSSRKKSNIFYVVKFLLKL